MHGSNIEDRWHVGSPRHALLVSFNLDLEEDKFKFEASYLVQICLDCVSLVSKGALYTVHGIAACVLIR